METRIKGAFFSKKGLSIIDIYGYSSKGLPGIEIIGLGRKGQSIKEKFIYISKCRRLHIPLKRYVLCIEGPSLFFPLTIPKKIMDEEGSAWLELPLLLLFWCLSGIINVNKLENCLAIGRVCVDGKIIILNDDRLFAELLAWYGPEDLYDKKGQLDQYGHLNKENAKSVYHLPLQELISSRSFIKRCTVITISYYADNNNNNSCIEVTDWPIQKLPLDKIFEKISDLYYERLETNMARQESG